MRKRAGFCYFFLFFFFFLFLSCFSSILSCHFYCLVALSVVGRNAKRTVRVGHSQRTKVENACALEFCCRFCHGLCRSRSRHAHTHMQTEPRCVTFCRLGRDRAACVYLPLPLSPTSATGLPSAYASACTPPPPSAFLPCLRSINLRPFGLHLFAFG